MTGLFVIWGRRAYDWMGSRWIHLWGFLWCKLLITTYFIRLLCRFFARTPGPLYDNFCLCYRTTLRCDFLHSFMVSRYCYAFQVHIGRLVTNQQKVIFLCLHFIFACRLVLYLYLCAVENHEISEFCEIRAVPTDHKRVKKIET